MGAQKKCSLLLGTIVLFLFCLFISIIFIHEFFISDSAKNKKKNLDSILFGAILIFILIIICIYLLIKTLKHDIKLILISKKKEENKNNIIIESDFIKRTEYKFTKTKIGNKKICGDKKIRKKITCITILNNNKILLGFSEGTIMLCLLQKNYELKQIFSFNKYKEKKIVFICESLKYKGEFMISIKAIFRPLKLLKINLDYKYSLIKVLARDKPYLIIKEYENKNWKNVFKIIAYENGQFLIADRKGIYLKEKINVFNYDDSECDEYQISQEYILNRELNEEIYDIIKINEESFATLENKDNISYLYFYKLNNFKKENNYISNIISTKSLSNRLCYINQSLISVFDSNSINFVNTILKQKVKTIKLDNIQKSGINLFYDGSIILIKNNIINGFKIPHIVKISKDSMNKGKEVEYNSFSFTNTMYEFNNEYQKKEFLNSKIKILKCLKNSGIFLMANSQGKLFIWEGINKNKEIIKLNNLY